MPLRTEFSVRRLTRLSLLTAAALAIYLLEGQLPPVLPIPGAKLGLANIVTLYTMFTAGPGDTLLVLLARILLGSVFSGRATTFFYSLAGGLLCYAVTCLLRRLLPRRQLWVAGVLGGICHNVGQLAVAVVITRTPALVVYLPWLLLFGGRYFIDHSVLLRIAMPCQRAKLTLRNTARNANSCPQLNQSLIIRRRINSRHIWS